MLAANKHKLMVFAVTVFILIISSSFLNTVRSSQLQLQQGQVLQYKFARMSTSSQAQQTGDALYQVLSFSQDALSFQISTEALFNYTISYKDGLPVYVDRLEALFYLPPEGVSQSLQGSLDWVNNVETYIQQSVVSKTSQVVNFTVDAGTFQCINMTLAVAGAWDSGNLSLLYDIDSGILVYELFVPEYGDVIVQYLASTEYVQVAQQGALAAILSVVLFSGTFATPLILAVYQTRKSLRGRRIPGQEKPAVSVIKSGFAKRALIIAVVGASLNLASVLLPWSQTRNSPTYLPLSLPPIVTQSTWVLPLNLTFTLITIGAYAAAVLAWLSIALHLYKARKLTPQLAALISSVVSFMSVAFFALTGWVIYWGLWVAVAGSALTLVSLAAANIHISIEVEPEESEKTNADPEENL